MKNLILAIVGSFGLTSIGLTQSDNCASAVQITPGLTSCSSQAGSSANATQSMVTCSGGGNADDDVWYYFTANSTTMNIEVDPTVGYDAVIQLLNGNCSAGQLVCRDVNGANGDEIINVSGLTIGVDYYFRVYHYGIGSGTSTFNVCVYGLAPASNNIPCNAFALPTVEPSCNFLTFTNAGSAGSSVATPTGCGGSMGMGGYSGGDVWFSLTVPPSGILDIHTQELSFGDGAMALYSGPCGSVSSATLVACDDDTGPGLMPYIYATGLTPGATMFIRVWEFGNDANGEFGICVSTPDNDNCVNAQQICDLNGYGGITSSSYTIDTPSNMCGIGDPLAPTPGCVFGTGYTGASPVQIDNNSWLQFTASSTTASLFVQINSCANGNGLQMQIFEGTNCTNFVAVSNFLETTTSQTVVATGLTPGNTYYIVVDGFAGDICSYTISATSGVQVVEAIAVDDQLCLGENTNITAQVTGTGSYTYTWSSDPFGTYPSTPTINVSPTVTTEYTVDITGLCGTTTSASVLVTVNNPPTANAGTNQTICDGQSANLNASGGTSYNWTGLGSGASQTVSPSTTTTYTVTATDANGCTDTDDVTVNVNPTPTANAGNDVDVCDGQSTTLTASGGGTYNWGSGFSGNPNNPVTPANTTSYTVTVENSFGCQDTDDVLVTVNPLPNANAGNDITVCNGGSTTLNATGGVSYDWDDPSLLDIANQTVGPLTSTVTYTVTVTDANMCVAMDAITITVGSALIPDAGTDSSVCMNDPLTYVATGGVNYTWTNSTGSTVSSTQTYTPPTSVPGTYMYYVDVTDGGSCSGNDSVEVVVNGLPTADAGLDETICNGDSVTISGSGGLSYDWNNGLGTGPSHTVLPTLTTTYLLTVTDINGCMDTDDIAVIVNALPTILASPDQVICAGETVSITANGGNTYSWDNGLGAGQSQNVTPANTTIYIVTGTNGNMCSNIDSVEVVVNDLPVIDSSSIQVEDADCLNGGGTISGISIIGNPSYDFEWADIVGNILDTTLSTGGLLPGDYILTVTDANNCVNTMEVNVGFTDLSTLTALDDSATTNPGISVNVNAYANDIGDSSTLIIVTPPLNGTAISNGDGTVSYTPNATFVGIDSLEYEICDKICPSACERAWIIFVVNDKLPVDVPNGFSPQGDGYNDFFVIEHLDQYPENTIVIFNRWGRSGIQCSAILERLGWVYNQYKSSIKR